MGSRGLGVIPVYALAQFCFGNAGSCHALHGFAGVQFILCATESCSSPSAVAVARAMAARAAAHARCAG